MSHHQIVVNESRIPGDDENHMASPISELEKPVRTSLRSRLMMRIDRRRTITDRGKIWIDLDNSPHVPFFVPIIDELQKLGYSLVITARDCSQVHELADLFHLKYKLIGRHYGKNKIRKVAGLFFRALQLMPTILREKPDLAVSHCSRSQLIAAASLGVPSLQMGDYEFAKTWLFVHPTWLLCPAVIPFEVVPGAPNQILKYPGIKEDVYVPRFVPDPDIRCQLGLDEQDLVVTIRPPASEAHYHNTQGDEFFEAVIEFLSRKPDAKLVVLPRNGTQANYVRSRWSTLFLSGKMRIPAQAVDGLNLIWHSDFVVSGGGTMNREAAALGVPVYSIFRGKIGAVDRYLSNTGRLVLLENVQDLRTKMQVARRNPSARPQSVDGRALKSIVEQIVAIMDTKCPAPIRDVA
jgi:predicted glycosyltransferase